MLIVYETYETAEEYAHKLCKFLENDTSDPPLTMLEVMIVHLNMGDPESRRRTELLVRQWVRPGGPYEHLTTGKKYSVQSKEAAERLGVHYKRVRNLPIVNRMKVVDTQVARVEHARHTPAIVKQARISNYRMIEQNAGKMLGRARTAEFLNSGAETDSVLNSEFRSKDERIESLEQQCSFLQKALLTALSGGVAIGAALPAPDAGND